MKQLENIITFASVTHAMKARELLRRHRISANLIRTPAKLRRGSCGYSLVIPRQFAQAAALVRDNRLPYRHMFGDDAP